MPGCSLTLQVNVTLVADVPPSVPSGSNHLALIVLVAAGGGCVWPLSSCTVTVGVADLKSASPAAIKAEKERPAAALVSCQQ